MHNTIEVQVNIDKDLVKNLCDSNLFTVALDLMGDRPQIVCLCGSTKFKETFLEAQRLLTLKGAIVLSVGCFGHADNHNFTEEVKNKLDELHRWKIKLSDYVVICHENGYVGQSTQGEIKFASLLRKKIRWFSLEKRVFEEEYIHTGE